MANDKVKIKLLKANQKVYPLVIKKEQTKKIKINLPEIVIENTGSTISIVGAEIVCKEGDHEIAVYKTLGKEFEKQASKTAKKYIDVVKNENLLSKIKYSGVDFPETLKDSLELNSNEALILNLSDFFTVEYFGLHDLTNLTIKLWIKDEDAAELNIELANFNSKDNYEFPLKGTLCIKNYPILDFKEESVFSQKFGIDVVDVRQLKNGDYATCKKDNPSSLYDYFIFERELMAAANGVVVEIGEDYPEDKVIKPWEYSEKKFLKVLKELEEKIGLKNAYAGNYIIIKHDNDEYSFYAHLAEKSIFVREGDQVRKGNIIGKVGVTGNSFEPHLHFMLLDSQDFLTANSLPVRFNDVKSADGIESNTLICSPEFTVKVD